MLMLISKLRNVHFDIVLVFGDFDKNMKYFRHRSCWENLFIFSKCEFPLSNNYELIYSLIFLDISLWNICVDMRFYFICIYIYIYKLMLMMNFIPQRRRLVPTWLAWFWFYLIKYYLVCCRTIAHGGCWLYMSLLFCLLSLYFIVRNFYYNDKRVSRPSYLIMDIPMHGRTIFILNSQLPILRPVSNKICLQ